MYFASIWLILNPVIIPIIGLVGSARTAVLILKSSKARAFKNAVFLQSLIVTLVRLEMLYYIVRYSGTIWPEIRSAGEQLL